MHAQAGVDLGTVMEEHAASQGKGKKRAKKGGSQGVEVRPKRRAPITQLLLVGGATRMPAFQRFVKNMTGLQPKGFTVDPDEVGSPSAYAYSPICVKPALLPLLIL